MTVSDQNRRWVTLREAADETQASFAALRRWYREGLIDSLVVPGAHGEQRLVDLDEVLIRASASPNIGRRRGPTRRDESDAVNEALIEQVAALAMEVSELRERVTALENANS